MVSERDGELAGATRYNYHANIDKVGPPGARGRAPVELAAAYAASLVALAASLKFSIEVRGKEFSR